MNKHFLYPTTIFASKNPTLITTILGSCVAVCLFDQNVGIGGMNHFMMPAWNGSGLASPKYGDIAMIKLVEKMISLGSNKNNIIAKVFGGGIKGTHFFNIGERNIHIAMDYLTSEHIPVVAQHVGGREARKIIFNTQNGEVRLKLI